jgi:hypothetical protein
MGADRVEQGTEMRARAIKCDRKDGSHNIEIAHQVATHAHRSHWVLQVAMERKTMVFRSAKNSFAHICFRSLSSIPHCTHIICFK